MYAYLTRDPLVRHFLSHFDQQQWPSVIRDTLRVGIGALQSADQQNNTKSQKAANTSKEKQREHPKKGTVPSHTQNAKKTKSQTQMQSAADEKRGEVKVLIVPPTSSPSNVPSHRDVPSTMPSIPPPSLSPPTDSLHPAGLPSSSLHVPHPSRLSIDHRPHDSMREIIQSPQTEKVGRSHTQTIHGDGVHRRSEEMKKATSDKSASSSVPPPPPHLSPAQAVFTIVSPPEKEIAAAETRRFVGAGNIIAHPEAEQLLSSDGNDKIRPLSTASFERRKALEAARVQMEKIIEERKMEQQKLDTLPAAGVSTGVKHPARSSSAPRSSSSSASSHSHKSLSVYPDWWPRLSPAEIAEIESQEREKAMKKKEQEEARIRALRASRVKKEIPPPIRETPSLLSFSPPPPARGRARGDGRHLAEERVEPQLQASGLFPNGPINDVGGNSVSEEIEIAANQHRKGKAEFDKKKKQFEEDRERARQQAAGESAPRSRSAPRGTTSSHTSTSPSRSPRSHPKVIGRSKIKEFVDEDKKAAKERRRKAEAIARAQQELKAIMEERRLLHGHKDAHSDPTSYLNDMEIRFASPISRPPQRTAAEESPSTEFNVRNFNIDEDAENNNDKKGSSPSREHHKVYAEEEDDEDGEENIEKKYSQSQSFGDTLSSVRPFQPSSSPAPPLPSHPPRHPPSQHVIHIVPQSRHPPSHRPPPHPLPAGDTRVNMSSTSISHYSPHSSSSSTPSIPTPISNISSPSSDGSPLDLSNRRFDDFDEDIAKMEELEDEDEEV